MTAQPIYFNITLNTHVYRLIISIILATLSAPMPYSSLKLVAASFYSQECAVTSDPTVVLAWNNLPKELRASKTKLTAGHRELTSITDDRLLDPH